MATIERATEIRAFQVEVPEEDLADLRRRIAATRRPERETVEDESQGVLLVLAGAGDLHERAPRRIQITALAREVSA